MTYSDAEMKALCLDLAERADQLEAEALRTLAANYTVQEQQKEQRYLELSFWQIMAISALVFIVWTPIFFWLSYGFPEDHKPPGAVVERLMGFTKTPDGRWITRTYRFSPREDFSSGVRKFVFAPDPVPLVVYENLTPLPSDHYEFQEIAPTNIWRFVTIRASDGTDPNKNGRRYYAVRP